MFENRDCESCSPSWHTILRRLAMRQCREFQHVRRSLPNRNSSVLYLHFQRPRLSSRITGVKDFPVEFTGELERVYDCSVREKRIVSGCLLFEAYGHVNQRQLIALVVELLKTYRRAGTCVNAT